MEARSLDGRDPEYASGPAGGLRSGDIGEVADACHAGAAAQ
jgi:hypothetical protein